MSDVSTVVAVTYKDNSMAEIVVVTGNGRRVIYGLSTELVYGLELFFKEGNRAEGEGKVRRQAEASRSTAPA